MFLVVGGGVVTFTIFCIKSSIVFGLMRLFLVVFIAIVWKGSSGYRLKFFMRWQHTGHQHLTGT